MLASPWLTHAFNIGSMWTLLGLGLFFCLSVPAVVWTGYLQGHNELARIGVYNVVVAAAKLAGAVIWPWPGWERRERYRDSGGTVGGAVGHPASAGHAAAVGARGGIKDYAGGSESGAAVGGLRGRVVDRGRRV